jgi:hypothetical protein
VNSEIELHDSVISQIQEIDRSVIVELSPAYVHKSKVRPGLDAGTVWVQNARLRLSSATLSGYRPVPPEALSDGSLWVGGLKHKNLLPATIQAHGLVELRLVFATGEETVISAEAIALELTGESCYVEEFSGGNLDPSRSS